MPGATLAESRAVVRITHGVGTSEVTATSALVWARGSGSGRLHVAAGTDRNIRRGVRRGSALARAATDYTAVAGLRGLRPGTRYFYRAWFSRRSQGLSGTFRTAPRPGTSGRVRFVVGGDVGGGRYCRHERWGFPAFFYISTMKPDFFVSLGDMIYADESCPVDGREGWRNRPGNFLEVDDRRVNWNDRAQTRDVYNRHWRYLRADRRVQYLFAGTSLYSTWDDHEVINDFGGSWSYWNAQERGRSGYRSLVDAGRDAFFAYGAIRRHARDRDRIYRSFRWGKDLQLFLTDTRSYRDRNEASDKGARPKTMLGAAQLAWLKRSLARSNATWKVITSSVPLSVPTGSTTMGRDGWADGEHTSGYERELGDLLRFLDARNIPNVVFLTGDVHFAQQLRFEKDYDGDRESLVLHEVIVGPLNARLYKPYWVDGTFNPRSLYGEGGFFNFGVIDVWRSRGGSFLRAHVRDGSAKLRRGSVLTLRAP